MDFLEYLQLRTRRRKLRVQLGFGRLPRLLSLVLRGLGGSNSILQGGFGRLGRISADSGLARDRVLCRLLHGGGVVDSDLFELCR